MLKACSRCGRVHDSRVSCARQVPRTSPADRFRSSRAWQRTREIVRARDLSLCRVCADRNPPEYVTEGLSVHHIVPLEEDFDLRDDEGNLVTLCSRCHEDAEAGRIPRDYLRGLAAHGLDEAEYPPAI